MRRRTVLRGLLGGLLGAGTGVAVSGFGLPLVHAADYRGKLFVFVQADGGWDPTSFCDPKANTPGEPVINHWAEHDEVRQAGRIAYAPFARNQGFFEKYHRRMLVINGVDAQTNSHTVGVVHNWSGRNAEGYPTTAALLAAHYAPDLAVPYLSFGGYSVTAGLTRFTRIDNARLLLDIANPTWDMPGQEVFSEATRAALESHLAKTAQRLETAPNLLPGDMRHRAFYRSAFATEGLKAYADAIPPEEELEQEQRHHGRDRRFLQPPAPPGAARGARVQDGSRGKRRPLARRIRHPREPRPGPRVAARQPHRLESTTSGSTPRSTGWPNRMVVVIGSDFGRTNFYNAQSGKDHWPIGSFVIMEKGQRWTGRAVGETDGLHFAQRINPRTLRRDDRNGTIIYPKHVHKALRRYLGIEHTPGAQRFPFNNTEDFAFFG